MYLTRKHLSRRTMLRGAGVSVGRMLSSRFVVGVHSSAGGMQDPPAQDKIAQPEPHSRMEPAGLTLIYASSYMNNPASMYGHTFFRVEPAG